MFRLSPFSDCFFLILNFSDNLLLLAQHFIRSDLMEDGQVAGTYAPDREEDDPADFEYNGEVPPSESTDDGESSGESFESKDSADDADAEAADPRNADIRTAAQGGTPDPSLEQFLAEWSDDDSVSKVGDSDAAPHAKPPKVPTKRASATGSSSGAALSKVAKTASTALKGKQPQAAATRVPTGQAPLGRSRGGPVLRDAPLNVAPLRCRMPTGAPRTVGYAIIFMA